VGGAIKIKESETLEFKKSTSELKEGIISIGAILNKHQKGKLYFGIKDNGIVIGQQIGKNTLRDISESVSNHIEPKIYPIVKKEKINGKNCALVEFSGSNIPYYAYGRAYMRVADEDRLMSAKEVEKLILEKNKDKLRWDKEICKEAKFNDTSIKRLKWFLEAANKKYHSVEESLDKLGLIKNGKLLNAAVILFGKKPQQFFHNAKLRCAVFATAETSLIVDRQEFEGDIFYLIEKAQEYILKNIHIGMRLEGMRRIDVPEIDKDAFREAIINAFCHRDYYEPDSVNIAIFKDRVEVRSPGGLYGGLTIEQIKKKMVSRRRNEEIANQFHEVHFVEKWGRGINLILSKEPNADFEVVAGIFVTRFKRKHYAPIITQKTTQKTTQKILTLINENSQITRNELAKALDISPDGVKYHLNNLKKKGILKRVGGRKEGHWEVIE